MNRNSLILGYLVVAFLLAATKVSSQGTQSTVKQTLSKNCISFSLSNREHFDGSPYMQLNYFGRRGWMKLGMGLEYSRTIGQKSCLAFSLNSLLANYYLNDQYPRRVGDVVRRDGALLELAYHRSLGTLKGWPIYALLGINYRRGYEFTYNYRYFSEINTTWYILREPGISIGLRASKLLFWRIELNAAAKFTQYFFRYDDGSIHGQHYFNRSTRNMLTMQLGLGFRF